LGRQTESSRNGVFALFFLVPAADELLKHFINRSRVELLKEIKQVQLQAGSENLCSSVA
jgi:hypothetical protein